MILVGTFGTIFARRKKSRKNTPKREALVINTFRLLSAPFYSNIYKSSAQNPFRAEDFCSIIIEAHHKSHRKPTDVLEISYGGPETCK